MLTASVGVSPVQAIDFLIQLDRHRGLHLYMESAQVTGAGDLDGLPYQDWVISDRLHLGPIPYRMRYAARMVRLSDTEITGLVRAAPGCHLQTTTSAIAVDEITRLEERTVVTAPAPLVGYMTKHARLAHAQTMKLLPAELARTVDGPPGCGR